MTCAGPRDNAIVVEHRQFYRSIAYSDVRGSILITTHKNRGDVTKLVADEEVLPSIMLDRTLRGAQVLQIQVCGDRVRQLAHSLDIRRR